MRRGYTIIELSLVIVVLALLAATIAPRLVALIEGGARRQYRADVVTLFGEARERAIQTNSTVTVTFAEGNFEMQSGSDTDDEESQTLRRVDAIEGVEIESFQLDGETVGDGDFSVSFYSDGTADSAAFAMTEGSGAQTVRVRSRTGRVEVLNGSPEEQTDPEERWPAGEIEQVA